MYVGYMVHDNGLINGVHSRNNIQRPQSASPKIEYNKPNIKKGKNRCLYFVSLKVLIGHRYTGI